MKFFTKKEVDLLISKDINLESIKKLDNTLLWYKKKVSCIDITITSQDILKLQNLSILVEENFSMFGVPYSKILREIIINKLISQSNSSLVIQKIFSYRTVSQMPSKNFYSGTMYHYVILYKDSIKIYNLDNYYRILEILNIPFKNIISFTKSDFKYNDVTFFYEIIKYTDGLKDSLIYLRVIDDKISIPKLDSYLSNQNITIVSQTAQTELKNAQAKRLFHKKILIAVLLFLLIISLYSSRL